MLNTTNGPVRYHQGHERHPDHTLNTSHAVEENLHYIDEEPEILSVLSAPGWYAVLEGESVPLACWVAEDGGRLYGVCVRGGRIDLVEGDVEKNSDFQGYVNNNDSKENK
jgi:hypothetical protein